MRGAGGFEIHRAYPGVEAKCRREILRCVVFGVLTNNLELAGTAKGILYSREI